ncbi:hypothetical protein [Microbacterium candidum]|uniref:MFS transporter n=1 Tax=Microbacterium candidum TaxID=3041922 RepID=A0ABT7N258_9MICO|nr:hypothetical protein [Microbacterium sp. ASV49]MDL9980758.1 hypothetical protein [Microbacterium sp. ASV49]
MGTRAARAWRGILAAAFAVFVASLSHSAAAGHAAPLLGVLLALTVAVPVCVLLAGRRLSWPRLAVAVAVSQFVFHALLQVGVADVGRVVPGMPAAPHMHDAMPAMLPALDAHVMATPGMWVAHACAAILTVLAFGAGERAVKALLDLVGWTFLARLVQGFALPQGPRILFSIRARVTAARLLLLSVAPRRGPPVTV